MRNLDLQSERYQPTGSISADGVKNQLGRPRIDRLTLLVRETVQNSWDARVGDDGPVLFAMAGSELTSKAKNLLLNTVFRRVPEGLAVRDELDGDRPATLLCVLDRGTMGLCGPTRADAPAAEGVRPNFVNLLRNVGHPPARVRGGGTYGFGKTALFLASRVRTIIAHSQVRAGRRIEQRLMVAGLGREFTRRTGKGQQLFTGRHWWGRTGAAGVVEPLVGREAGALANAIGLPRFGEEETGTTIALLFPDFEDRSPHESLRFVSQALLRSFWPKMVDGPERTGTMKFVLSWNGESIAIPRPQDVPPFGGFVSAFHSLQATKRKSGETGDRFVRQLECLKPYERLGNVAMCRFPLSPRLDTSDGAGDRDPFNGPCHHVALLRGPRFVVRYLEGPPVPFEQVEYAGVFLASDAAEPAFARSEPPTHDDWVPDILEDRHERTFVRVAVRRIREVMEEFSGARPATDSNANALPLGEFSDLLGGLIPSVTGTGASVPRESFTDGTPRSGQANGTPSPRAVSRSAAKISLGTERLEVFAGKVALIVPFEIEKTGEFRPITVTARPGVALEEGAIELEPPVSAEVPHVLAWVDNRGKTLGTEAHIVIESLKNGPWLLAVTVPPDVSVGVEISISDEKVR